MVEGYKRIGYWLAGVIILVVIVNVISSNVSVQYILGTINPKTPVYDKSVYDKLIVPAIIQVLSSIPENETIVSSGSAGIIKYFTGHMVKTPRYVDSQESLVKYMSKNNFTYLIVTSTNAPTLKKIFDEKDYIKNFESDFQKITAFKTQFDEIRLFKRITNA
jgi:predicted SnoaL-like aldol condensation-catalyzing enzyme